MQLLDSITTTVPFRILALILIALDVQAVQPADSDIPLADGVLSFRNASFIGPAFYTPKAQIPRIDFVLVNRTSLSWKIVRLRLVIGGLCAGEPRHWIEEVSTPLGWIDDHPLERDVHSVGSSPADSIQGCKAHIIRPFLLSAVSLDNRLFSGNPPDLDLRSELLAINARLETEEAEASALRREQEEARAKQAAEEARAAEQRKAAEAVRIRRAAAAKKQRAAEQKKRDEEAAAQAARQRAEQQAATAEKLLQVRINCAAIYRSTIDKKRADLTIREEQQVRACSALGLYPPD